MLRGRVKLLVHARSKADSPAARRRRALALVPAAGQPKRRCCRSNVCRIAFPSERLLAIRPSEAAFEEPALARRARPEAPEDLHVHAPGQVNVELVELVIVALCDQVVSVASQRSQARLEQHRREDGTALPRPAS